jgi:hypothetical protein
MLTVEGRRRAKLLRRVPICVIDLRSFDGHFTSSTHPKASRLHQESLKSSNGRPLENLSGTCALITSSRLGRQGSEQDPWIGCYRAAVARSQTWHRQEFGEMPLAAEAKARYKYARRGEDTFRSNDGVAIPALAETLLRDYSAKFEAGV